MKKLLFAAEKQWHEKLFSKEDLSRIESLCEILSADIPAQANKQFLLEYIGPAEIIISSWGTAALDAEVTSRATKLQLLSHAGGIVGLALLVLGALGVSIGEIV